MLAANKDFIIADARSQAVSLHRLELDVFVERYTDLISIASIAAGFSFSGIVEFEIPDDDIDAANEGTLAPETMNLIGVFYICSGIALACGIYVVIVSTVVVTMGYRLALSGSEHHSLERAVAVLMRAFPWVLTAGGVGLCAMLLAGFAMVWLKMENRVRAIAWTGSSIIFAFGIIFTAYYIIRIAYALRTDVYVHGDVRIQMPGAKAAVDFEDFSLHRDGAQATTTASTSAAAGAVPQEAMPAGATQAPPKPGNTTTKVHFADEPQAVDPAEAPAGGAEASSPSADDSARRTEPDTPSDKPMPKVSVMFEGSVQVPWYQKVLGIGLGDGRRASDVQK